MRERKMRMKSLIVLTALTGLLAVGCHSNRGGTKDQQEQNSGYYNNGSTENPNLNVPPNSPEQGPGAGGMGGTSTAPGNSSTGRGTSDTAPNNNNQSDINKDNNNPSGSGSSSDNNPAPSNPDNNNPAPK